jgi:hypothetical protein
MIDNLTSCNIRTVICFLHANNISAVEIHHELCMVVYGQNVLSKGTVRQWCRMLEDEWTSSWWRVKWSAFCSEWSSCSKSWPKYLLKTVLHICKTCMWISTNFMHSSVWDYYQVLHKMGSENAHGCTQNAENGFIIDFFRTVPQRWWISQSHHMSNRWWNLGFIGECWNQEAVKALDAHIHQTGWKNLNKRLRESWWHMFCGPGKECGGVIHGTRDHSIVRSVLWDTKTLHKAI